MKQKQKSPTKNDIVKVSNLIIREMEMTKRKLYELSFTFDNYVEMKGDREKFIKFIESKIKTEKESVESKRNDSKGSSKE